MRRLATERIKFLKEQQEVTMDVHNHAELLLLANTALTASSNISFKIQLEHLCHRQFPGGFALESDCFIKLLDRLLNMQQSERKDLFTQLINKLPVTYASGADLNVSVAIIKLCFEKSVFAKEITKILRAIFPVTPIVGSITDVTGTILTGLLKSFAVSTGAEVELACALTSFALRACRESKSLAISLSQDLIEIFGKVSGEETTINRKSITFKIATGRSVEGLLSVVLGWLQDRVLALSWMVTRASNLFASSTTNTGSLLGYVTKKMEEIGKVIALLCTGDLPAKHTLSLCNILCRSYKTLVSLNKIHINLKIRPGNDYNASAKLFAQELCREVYILLPNFQQQEVEKAREMLVNKKKERVKRQLKVQMDSKILLILGHRL